EFYPLALRTAASRATVREAIEDTAFATFDRTADIVGRRASVGSSWSVEAPTGGGPTRTYLVKGIQTCPRGTCVWLDETIHCDPGAVAQAVQSTVDELLSTAREPADVRLREGAYKAGGSMVLDPRTMMGVNSKTSAEGAFSFEGKDAARPVTVEL